MIRFVSLLLFLLVFFTSCAVPDTARSEVQHLASLPEGEKIFRMQCAICHNQTGSGGMDMPYLAEKSLFLADKNQFIGFLRKPKSTMMPAFSEERLSDEDASILYQWLMDYVAK